MIFFVLKALIVAPVSKILLLSAWIKPPFLYCAPIVPLQVNKEKSVMDSIFDFVFFSFSSLSLL